MGLSTPLNGETYFVCDCYTLFRLSIYMSKIALLIPVVYTGIVSSSVNNIDISYPSWIYIYIIIFAKFPGIYAKYVYELYICVCISLSIDVFFLPMDFLLLVYHISNKYVH